MGSIEEVVDEIERLYQSAVDMLIINYHTVVNGVFNVFDKHSSETFLDVIHNQCIEVVGADKAESEE